MCPTGHRIRERSRDLSLESLPERLVPPEITGSSCAQPGHSARAGAPERRVEDRLGSPGFLPGSTWQRQKKSHSQAVEKLWSRRSGIKACHHTRETSPWQAPSRVGGGVGPIADECVRGKGTTEAELTKSLTVNRHGDVRAASIVAQHGAHILELRQSVDEKGLASYGPWLICFEDQTILTAICCVDQHDRPVASSGGLRKPPSRSKTERRRTVFSVPFPTELEGSKSTALAPKSPGRVSKRALSAACSMSRLTANCLGRVGPMGGGKRVVNYQAEAALRLELSVPGLVKETTLRLFPPNSRTRAVREPCFGFPESFNGAKDLLSRVMMPSWDDSQLQAQTGQIGVVREASIDEFLCQAVASWPALRSETFARCSGAAWGAYAISNARTGRRRPGGSDRLRQPSGLDLSPRGRPGRVTPVAAMRFHLKWALGGDLYRPALSPLGNMDLSVPPQWRLVLRLRARWALLAHGTAAFFPPCGLFSCLPL
ncbi:hypothetical protein CMUS01_10443 [Colletotrichum musicola]|uniref:Uncharacterized protein n=1 Tax=Colletotrichum musicola TaxID=2175873 RepID=A0A8H6K427_9PEZI|nr:hypothetical protein CMUS01_10443 [Colletotrichum musicola]